MDMRYLVLLQVKSDVRKLCFSLQIHKVDTLVSYKNDDWDEP